MRSQRSEFLPVGKEISGTARVARQLFRFPIYKRSLCFHRVVGSSPTGGAKKKDRFRTVFFLSNPKDWYVITRRVYGIRRKATAWHHAQRVSFLRIDYIHHSVMIPCRRQAADFIHAYRRDYIESYVEVLDFQGLFVFLGVKNTPLSPLHLFPDLLDLNLQLCVNTLKKF